MPSEADNQEPWLRLFYFGLRRVFGEPSLPRNFHFEQTGGGAGAKVV